MLLITPEREKVADAIYSARMSDSPDEKRAAVRWGVFTYVSGKIGPEYFDLRVIPSFPESFKTIIETLAPASLRFAEDNDALWSGIVTSADTGLLYATPIALKHNTPLVYVRKKKKEYGTGGVMSGVFKKGDWLLGLDDLITTTSTLQRVVNTVRDADGKIVEYFVVVDRKQYDPKDVDALGVRLESMVDVNFLIDRGEEKWNLSSERADLAREYHKDETSFVLSVVENNPDRLLKDPKVDDIVSAYKENEKIMGAFRDAGILG